jgi:trimeric autotransporter adhesin
MKTVIPHFTLSLMAAALVTLTACGGGGGSASSVPTPASTTAVSTTVMDGLIQNALVCVDSNNNGVCESTEVQGRTDSSGKVTLSIPTANVTTAKLLAMIGLDATDADTGSVKTAYTLQTPAGKHSVISPLTNMVQTKMETDKVSGIVTSIDAAEAYVKTQTSLTISVFDNFIAKRETSTEHKKAGDIARLLVVSTQKSIATAVTGSASNTGCTTSEGNGNHAVQAYAENDLVTRLSEIRKLSDDIDQWACASTNSAKTCDSDIQSKAPVVARCTTVAATTPVVTTPVVTTPVVATPVVTVPVVVTSAATGKSVYAAKCALCHTATPALNVSKVLKGANSASTILNAISGNVGGMGMLQGNISTQDANNLAAYLATPTL